MEMTSTTAANPDVHTVEVPSEFTKQQNFCGKTNDSTVEKLGYMGAKTACPTSKSELIDYLED